MNIQEFRKKYPEYDDISDDKLAKSFHKKYYSDLPYDEFSKKIGLPEKSFIEKVADNPAITGFATGVENVTHGILQPLLESGYLGQGMSDASKRIASDRMADFARAKEESPWQ